MRVKGGTVTHARRKRMLKRAKGYFGSKHLLYKTAKSKLCTAYAMRTSLVELSKEITENYGLDVLTPHAV